MKTCEKCNKPFGWSTIAKSLWRNYRPIECSECGTVHKITTPSRMIFVSLTILPMVLFAGYFSANPNYFLILVGAFLILLIGSMLAPFYVSYKRSV